MKVRSFKHILQYTVAIIVVAAFSSCTTSQEIIYFQDEPLSSLNSTVFKSEIKYKANDLLTINVSALDPETVRPFNLPVITNSLTSLNPQGNATAQTYIIDDSGNIEFPVLGTLKLGGLTRNEASLMLKEKISEYVNNPIINIRLTNFTVTVLGEVNNPGTFKVEEEKISLLEAIGLAGDLTIHGVRDNIFLIREQDGVKRFTKFDLTSINVVNQPNYYLEQNDVIYVEPNPAKIRSASYNQNYVLIISAVGTLATIAAILVR
ncbi:polysaccharide biosynthesis/export family protein [Xanthomarina sp. F2636L]|uniref:polysaccharide biosynthesis/export family protein n=1 Tax=Xanthomarina sp. F2636L TaxID=2996018 RepID=UPI00225E5E43|nr:polysaccharide biosynthesis/export family protein [Xanthomarina sp. F2636L]MCX7549496.1 polysaccharide biosynthesis/export family protein [Xanthomarina sp. F2636L]